MRLSHDRTGLPERSSFTLLRLSTAAGSCRERRAGIPPYGRPTRARENKLSENLTIRREAHALQVRPVVYIAGTGIYYYRPPCSYVFVRVARAMGMTMWRHRLPASTPRGAFCALRRGVPPLCRSRPLPLPVGRSTTA